MASLLKFQRSKVLFNTNLINIKFNCLAARKVRYMIRLIASTLLVAIFNESKALVNPQDVTHILCNFPVINNFIFD